MVVAENPPGITGGLAPYGKERLFRPDYESRLATTVLRFIIPVLNREVEQGGMKAGHMNRIFEIVAGSRSGKAEVSLKVFEALDKAKLLKDAVQPGNKSDEHIEYVVALPGQETAEDVESFLLVVEDTGEHGLHWSIERRLIKPAENIDESLQKGVKR